MADSSSLAPEGFALVLGGGGWSAHAYFAGVFDAFAEMGIDLGAAAFTSGTSAGALNAALLMSRVPLSEAADIAQGWGASGTSRPFERAWSGPRDLRLRLRGNVMLMQALMAPRHLREGGRDLARQRVGLYRTRDPGSYYGRLSEEWPDTRVALVAFDAVRGRRVVLTRESSLGLPFRRAVEASMAIPSLLQPVRTDRHVLVDGGVASATNLDVAAESGAVFTICIAPMSYDLSLPPAPVRQLAYGRANRTLAAQARRVQASGQDVLYIRPGREVVRELGLNPLRTPDVARIRHLALQDARRQLRHPIARGLLEQLYPRDSLHD